MLSKEGCHDCIRVSSATDIIVAMALISSFARMLARRAVAHPRVREEATKLAAKTVREAREIAADPSPARKLGRVVSRAKRRLSETIKGRD